MERHQAAASSPGSPPAGAGNLSGVDALIHEPRAQSYWFRRVIAFVVDAVIVYLVVGLIGFAFAFPFLFVGGAGAFAAVFAGTYAVASGVLLFLYFMLADAASGATLGKRALGLRVTGAAGGRPTIAEAAIRNLSKLYGLLLFLDVVVGLATSKGYTQKYSDRLARTDVVEAR